MDLHSVSILSLLHVEKVVVFVLDLASSADVCLHVVGLFSLVIRIVHITLGWLRWSNLGTIGLSVVNQRLRSRHRPHIIVDSIIEFLREDFCGVPALDGEGFPESKGISDAKDVETN